MTQDDKYTYPGSDGVLRNALNITNGKRLDAAMNELATSMWASVLTEPVPFAFDFAYLQHIHSSMFADLFPWAGRIRDVDTVAGNTGIVYARPAFINQQLDEMFGQLARDEVILATKNRAIFSERLAEHWGYLSLIHPFRDGNTRSQSLFVHLLAVAAGHPIDWRLLSVDRLRAARLRAMQGHETELAALILAAINSENPPTYRAAPTFRADNLDGPDAALQARQERCGKLRHNGLTVCLRRVSGKGCPYHA